MQTRVLIMLLLLDVFQARNSKRAGIERRYYYLDERLVSIMA
jgi:hypothetical protein